MKPLPQFSVTYGIVTPESAAEGEESERGFISEGERLRDAVQDFTGTRTNRCDSGQGVENSGRWFTCYNGMEFETSAEESRSLHPPASITPASYKRLARLLGAQL